MAETSQRASRHAGIGGNGPDAPPEPQRRAERSDDDREGRARRRWYQRPLVLAVLALVLLIGIVIAIIWWLGARQWESTDDAYIAAHVSPVTPRIAGVALRVNVNDNQDVAAGAVLVEIDPRDIQARLDQARAGLAVAQAAVQTSRAAAAAAEADVSAAEAEADRRAADLKRFQSLDPRVVSQQQLDAARAAAQTADAQLRAAQTRLGGARASITESEARIQQSQAALRQAELELSYTTLRASVAGRVTQKNVSAGQYLQVGQPLMAIVPLEVYVTANFKETQITHMRPGQEAWIKVDAYPDREFAGHVDSIQSGSGAAFSLLPPENATGNFVKVVQRVPVKIVFDDNDAQRSLLGPGMSAVPRVHIAGERHQVRPPPVSPPPATSQASGEQ
jgi:membrane fusion protein (multidrug efflux system)